MASLKSKKKETKSLEELIEDSRTKQKALKKIIDKTNKDTNKQN